MESLGRILRTAREARGWSLARAAGKVGTTPAALGSWERAERNPPVGEIANALAGYGLQLLVTDSASTVRQARIEALRAELAQLEAL